MLGLHVESIFKSKSLNHFRSTVIKLPLIPEHSSLRLCVGKGTLTHTITLSNASIDDFRYVRKKGKIYRSALNSAARTNLDYAMLCYAMLFYFILKFLIQNSWF